MVKFFGCGFISAAIAAFVLATSSESVTSCGRSLNVTVTEAHAVGDVDVDGGIAPGCFLDLR